MTTMPVLDSATGSAPGSIGNVGPGLDMLGLALAGPRDEVCLAWRNDALVIVIDPGHPDLPSDPGTNTAAVAARSVLHMAGIDRGFTVSVRKGLPVAGGQGGSAASAVAGAVAANRLAGLGLDAATLLTCALDGEAVASGRQPDNLGPSLLGGFVLVRSIDPIDMVRLPVPATLCVVLAHPAQRLTTRDARAVLPLTVTRDVALRQAANVAAMVAGACLGDLALLGRGMDDRIAEPARAALLPGFTAAKRAALDAGALGASISGAGPTAFALVDGPALGALVAAAMRDAYAAAGVTVTVRVTTVDREGATAW